MDEMDGLKWMIADGQLADGRFVEVKRSVPGDLADIARRVVAMANTRGGVVVFGYDEREQELVGLGGDLLAETERISKELRELTLGVEFKIRRQEAPTGGEAVIVDVAKSESTAYFSRWETSPERQIKYTLKGRKTEAEADMRYEKVYKYMTLEAFLTSLYTGTWRFCEPSRWSDKFEQRFYCARYLVQGAQGQTPQVFATCVTRERNSEAAWKVYANGQGLGAHCVQFEVDIVSLRRQLRAQGYRFEERMIEYLRDQEIEQLHRKRSRRYAEFFGNFSLKSFLRLLSLKREAYAYEKEVRFFMIPPADQGGKPTRRGAVRDMRIDWAEVIIQGRIDRRCTPAELESLREACNHVGIEPIIRGHRFLSAAAAQPGLKQVNFELFDIDAMPGPARITIR